jgi:hypothetical protein
MYHFVLSALAPPEVASQLSFVACNLTDPVLQAQVMALLAQ